jgi:hypothetical protein
MFNQMSPKEIPVGSYEEFVREINHLHCRDWVFRGHPDVKYHIEPSLKRFYRTHQKNIGETSRAIREYDAIRKFQKSAHHFLTHLPDDEDLLSWLAIMQHFGAPTRLVDFTYSAHAALFFAAVDSVKPVASEEKPDEAELDKKYRPYSVHALNLKAIQMAAYRVVRRRFEIKEDDFCIRPKTEQTKDFVSFFEGRWQNPRQVAQQGLFMIPSRIDLDIHGWLRECPAAENPAGPPWRVYNFPGGRASYKRMIRALISSNLTHASLFPGIEGVARSMYLRLYEPITKIDEYWLRKSPSAKTT